MALYFLVAIAPVAHAAIFDNASKQACAGVSLSENATNCDSKSDRGVNNLIQLVINGLSLVVGVAAVIMIIVGGLKYITSQGDSSSTAAAKNTILYAVVGLGIVVAAQLILRFVVQSATKAIK